MSKNEKKLIKRLKEEAEIADRDSDNATAVEDATYYGGYCDGVVEAIKIVKDWFKVVIK